MNEPTTPGRILKLAQHDPIVHAYVQLWRNGRATWDQAMMGAVLTLAEQHKAAMQTAQELMLRSTMPPFPIPGVTPPAAPPPGPKPPEGVDTGRLMHILVNEVCTCGVSVSIEVADHGEDCRAARIIRRVKGPPT